MLDVPMIAFCLCPFATEVFNGDGAVAGLSAVITNLFRWGIPYAIGRAYLSDIRGVRDLAIGLIIGAAIYLPLVWLEVRISPQLHRMVYGYHQFQFNHAFRYGGYRPRVFLLTSIMLSTFMSAGAVAGLWLWCSKALSRLWRLPMALLVPLFVVTTILCKCGTGYMQLAIGIPVCLGTKWLRSRALLLAFVIAPAIYIPVRAMNLWSGSHLVGLVGELVEQRSAVSLSGRLTQETAYVKQALKRPFFGSGDDRFMRDDEGKRLFRGIEAFWVISLGLNGMVSVAYIYLAFLLPGVVLIRRIPLSAWGSPTVAPVLALVAVTAMYAADCLINGHLNPIYHMGLGALSGLAGGCTLVDRYAHRLRAGGCTGE